MHRSESCNTKSFLERFTNRAGKVDRSGGVTPAKTPISKSFKAAAVHSGMVFKSSAEAILSPTQSL
jgi:hypothetical protein